MHKGPTIRPLDRDAFDVADVDHVATDFTDLNVVVEHVDFQQAVGDLDSGNVRGRAILVP